MFYQCLSLKEFPDILNFNYQKVKDISFIFYNCKNLKKQMDIFMDKIKNINKKDKIFDNEVLFNNDISNAISNNSETEIKEKEKKDLKNSSTKIILE